MQAVCTVTDEGQKIAVGSCETYEQIVPHSHQQKATYFQDCCATQGRWESFGIIGATSSAPLFTIAKFQHRVGSCMFCFCHVSYDLHLIPSVLFYPLTRVAISGESRGYRDERYFVPKVSRQTSRRNSHLLNYPINHARARAHSGRSVRESDRHLTGRTEAP